MINFCGNCGAEQHEGALFCSTCGTKVQAGEADAPSESMMGTHTGRRTRKSLFIIGGGLVLISGIVAAVSISSVMENQRLAEEERIVEENARQSFLATQAEIVAIFEDVARECSKSGTGFDYGKDYLIIDHKGQDDLRGASYGELQCVFENLEVPKADISKMEGTRALDGTLESDWESSDGTYSIEASWTYHPDDGLDITFRLRSDFLKDYVAPEFDENS